MSEFQHGTESAYRRPCRCPVCREGHNAREREHYRKRKAGLGSRHAPPHGTVSRYVNRRCRCPDCTAANTAYRRTRRTA